MKRNSFYKNRFVYISLVLLLSFALSSCGKKIRIVDPVELDFSCAVYNNALGGTVNKSEIRETCYEPGSFLFMPSGTSNILKTQRVKIFSSSMKRVLLYMLRVWKTYAIRGS